MAFFMLLVFALVGERAISFQVGGGSLRVSCDESAGTRFHAGSFRRSHGSFNQ